MSTNKGHYEMYPEMLARRAIPFQRHYRNIHFLYLQAIFKHETLPLDKE